MPPAQHSPEAVPTVDLLQHLDQHLDDLEATLRRHPRILMGAGAAALLACGIVFYASRARHRRERHREAFLALAGRFLGAAPGAEPAAESGALKSSLKKVTAALVAAAAREVGRRALLALATRVSEPEHGGQTASA